MYSEYVANPAFVAAGLASSETFNGEPMLTDAGLFCLAGMVAYDPDTDEERRYHILGKVLHVIRVAEAGGMDHEVCNWLTLLFAEQTDPVGEGDKEKLLATLCRLVALFVGPGRVAALMGEEKPH